MYFSDVTMKEKYKFFYDTLHRLCAAIVADQGIVYNDFFSQLQAVCRKKKYRLYEVDRFRWRARQVNQGEAEAEEKIYYQDVVAFFDAYAHFSETEIPEILRVDISRQHPDALKTARGKLGVKQEQTARSIRFVVEKKTDDFIFAVSPLYPRAKPWKVDFSQNDHTRKAASMLTEGMQFNAVSAVVDEKAGTVSPEMIVIEPDYLVDVTSICGCIKDYGESPLNYLLKKFEPGETTKYIVLGNITGQFLDDCINNPEVSYVQSVRKAFKSSLVDITACDGIDSAFFKECERQFTNIKNTICQLYSDPNFVGVEGNVMLEPSFFCEALGIQGRFDFLQCDYKNLIEMKSGQWDKFRQSAKVEHLMQMILYKEILYYNLGISRQKVCGYVFYSKYPMMLEQRSAREMVYRMMDIRNGIVLLERGIKDGHLHDYLDRLTPDILNVNHVTGKLWTDYERPDIEALLLPLHTADPLALDYFYTFFAFVSREQYLARVGDGSVGSTRGMSNLWNADLDTKLQNGDIMIGLSLKCEPDGRISTVADEGDENVISSVVLLKPNDPEAASPNFRIGDSVILYQRNSNSDTAITRQVIRCGVETFDEDSVTLRLKHPQSNPKLFSTKSLYAVEHEYMDSSIRPLYRGLYSFLTASQSRRDLLLCRRDARVNTSVKLKGKYINSQIDDIVLRAKQAEDYFLLLGPPGTGKTSIALKSMVEEFRLEEQTLLLLAYTNRAVDEICETLGDCNYLRIGRELSCSPASRSHLIENMVGDDVRRESVRKLIADTPIVVGTVSSLVSSSAILKIKHFDAAIFDEASQLLEPQLLSLLCDEQDGVPSISKFIMIGDHKQLPAVVVQDEDCSRVESARLQEVGLTNCRNSLFERLYNHVSNHVFDNESNNESNYGPDNESNHESGNSNRSLSFSLLSTQGRMHPDIADFASNAFYEGVLQPVGLPHQQGELPYHVFTGEERFVATTRCGFIDIPLPPVNKRRTKMNYAEAVQIAAIVKQLRHLATENNLTLELPRQVGIIVPFRRQITMVRQALYEAGVPEASDVMIDTVERYQGSQRDIIIYGTTISSEYELDILSNIVEQNGEPVDRKLNVAVTRARRQLFVLGNKQLLSCNPIYRRLIDYADEGNLI